MVWSATSASSTMPKPHKHGACRGVLPKWISTSSCRRRRPRKPSSAAAATGAAAGLTVPAVSDSRAPQRRYTGNAAASFITRVIRASATDRRACLARRHESSDERLLALRRGRRLYRDRDFLRRSAGDHLRAAKAANLPHDVLSSWVWTISIGSGVLGILLSVRYRVPIIIAGRHRARRCW